MSAVRRVLRSPWSWVVVGLILVLLPKVVFLVFFLLGYAALMFASARFRLREWRRTGEINARFVKVRRRWAARLLIGSAFTLGTFALILALDAVIVGVPSN